MSKVCAKVMYLTASEERKYKGNGPKVRGNKQNIL